MADGYHSFVKRLVQLTLFLAFTIDKDTAYSWHITAPLAWLYSYLLDPSVIKIRTFDIIMLGVLVAAPGRKAYAAPTKHSLLLVLATTVLWFVYGVVMSGDSRSASWQTYRILSMVIVAFAVAATHRTSADFRGLAKWLIAAAAYRAVMCWISYFTWGRDTVGDSGAFLTSHDDTIGWVVGILILVVHIFERRSLKRTVFDGLLILFFLGAIQWNSRRLAWVSFAMGLVIAYLLFPPGKAKRRVNRVVTYVVPILILYVVVGWGRSNRIFLPLRSLSTVSTQEDASTLARNAENLGLILTANSSHFAIGTGWGHRYFPVSMKYDISSSFELWPYVPHNSILGLLAFTGALGFAGFWLAIPTSVFLNARVARLSPDVAARGVGIIGAAQLIVCVNQLYADMGLFDVKPMYVMAVSYAIALRLPVVVGVWPAIRGGARSAAAIR